MRIGVDLDNTIISYSGVFHRVARMQDILPEGVGTSKVAVKQFLIEDGRHDDWTRLQGEVYGKYLHLADIYSDIQSLFQFFDDYSLPYYIVSHKTKHPALGNPYDLHEAAHRFLEERQFFSRFSITTERVFFEPTMEKKSQRIATLGCTHFIDDLAHFLLHPSFPSSCQQLHFSPEGASPLPLAFSSHLEIINYLKEAHA